MCATKRSSRVQLLLSAYPGARHFSSGSSGPAHNLLIGAVREGTDFAIGERMRLVFCLFSAVLAAGFGLPALSPQLSAQQQPAFALRAASEPPEAPQPQFAVAAVDPPVQPSSSGSSETAQGSSSSTAVDPQQPGGEKHAKSKVPQQIPSSSPQPGSISGTAMDQNNDIIPGATVVLEGPSPQDRRTVVANSNGSFEFGNLKSGTPYHVIVSASGFISWTSPTVTLTQGQFEILTNIQLQIAGTTTSVTVTASSQQIAVEQVKVEEQQRVFGIIPNFYVTYDPNPAPLTTKLKFQMAFKTSFDPVTIAGIAFLAGIDQAASTPNYVEGAKGYGQRVGAVTADGFSDLLIGGAVLPSLLHQDPRYFYQGTGTKKSRALHALASAFICRGDNGQREPNYSTIGGDLASAALSNTYYPESNRGVGLFVSSFSINTSERMVSDLVQEFILSRFTSRGKD